LPCSSTGLPNKWGKVGGGSRRSSTEPVRPRSVGLPGGSARLWSVGGPKWPSTPARPSPGRTRAAAKRGEGPPFVCERSGQRQLMRAVPANGLLTKDREECAILVPLAMHTQQHTRMSSRETRRAHVVVPETLLDEVDRLVGKRGRSSFFVEAATEKLRRQKLTEAAKRFAGSLRDVDTPGWNTDEETDAFVRRLRAESEERLARKRGA
jgi:hypothetical protein